MRILALALATSLALGLGCEDDVPGGAGLDATTGGDGTVGGVDATGGSGDGTVGDSTTSKGDGPTMAGDGPGDKIAMSFFITSRAGSGKLGGLAGADKICGDLAKAVGSTKTWRAYLSTFLSDAGFKLVHAKDRIGTGPWYNQKLVKIADNVADLHTPTKNKLAKATGLNEKGFVVKGKGDNPNQHDIITGSTAAGMVSGRNTCLNWTSEATRDKATVGHFDRDGGGAAPTSWNSAHLSSGCTAANFISFGGAGKFYCFAIN